MQSQMRKNHKRANWFVGVFELARRQGNATQVNPQDVVFSTLRAGGPGGQHQNTTDSAVRAVHSPTGRSVVVRDNRSQHRNKAQALTRLQDLFDAQMQAELTTQRASQNQMHMMLERGNPVRVFKQGQFKEERPG